MTLLSSVYQEGMQSHEEFGLECSIQSHNNFGIEHLQAGTLVFRVTEKLLQ